jgi:methionyl-tRNA formyltransferase
MNIVLFATDSSVFRLVTGLALDDKVVAVIYPSNRKGTDKVQALECHAKGHALDVFEQPKSGSENALVDIISNRKPTVGISWFYSQILPPSILQIFPKGILNMHGGKIPEYRGANVLQWCIINGEDEVGVTWHSMVEAVDAGPIWAASTLPIEPIDDAWTVRHKIIEEGVRLFRDFWPHFKYEMLKPHFPDLSRGHVWPSRRERDSELPQRLTRRQLTDFMRALCLPWPRPYTLTDEGEKVEVVAVHDSPPADRENFVPYLLRDGDVVSLEIRRLASEH